MLCTAAVLNVVLLRHNAANCGVKTGALYRVLTVYIKEKLLKCCNVQIFGFEDSKSKLITDSLSSNRMRYNIIQNL